MKGWKRFGAIMPNFKVILGMKTDKSVGAILSKLTCPRRGFDKQRTYLISYKAIFANWQGKRGRKRSGDSPNSHFPLLKLSTKYWKEKGGAENTASS
jgi:hypothetical protein